MGRSIESRVTVAAPAQFVRTFMLDIHNWQKVMPSAAMIPGGLRWQGEPWSVGSQVVAEGRVLGMTLRLDVVSPNPGELFRIESRRFGFSYVTGFQADDAGAGGSVAIVRTILGGWPTVFAAFIPRSSIETGQQFSAPAIKTEIELAWLRAKESRARGE